MEAACSRTSLGAAPAPHIVRSVIGDDPLVALEQAEPDLADGGEAGDGVPEPADRDLADFVTERNCGSRVTARPVAHVGCNRPGRLGDLQIGGSSARSRDIPVGSPLPGLVLPGCAAPWRQAMRGASELR